MAGLSSRSGSGYAFSTEPSASAWAPARLATTANVAVLAGGAPNTVDGIAVAVGNRILVRSQAALPTNGIYVVDVVGGGANGSWSRALDASVSSDFVDGKIIAVGEGATLADTLWEFVTDAPFTLGVSNVVFIQVTPATALTGWTRDAGPPATVRLTTATDQVAIGTATPTAARKVTILTTGTDQGIRVTGTGAADNLIDGLNAGEANVRYSVSVSGSTSWGPGGGAAPDTRMQRTAANTLTFDRNGAGTVTLLPGTTKSQFGSGTLTWDLFANTLNVDGLAIATISTIIGNADPSAWRGDAGAGGITLTLPDLNSNRRKLFLIAQVAGAGSVTVAAAVANTVNGAASRVYTAGGRDSFMFYAPIDGTDWVIF